MRVYEQITAGIGKKSAHIIGGGIGGCPPLRSWSQGCVQRKSWDEFATPDAPKLDFVLLILDQKLIGAGA